MKDSLKKLFLLYQRAMFYSGTANNELRKPMVFYNEAIQLVTLLAVLGIRATPLWVATGYVGVFIIFIILGRILIFTGIAKYNQTLQNQQNVELNKILNRIDDLEKKIDTLNV